MAAGEPLPPVSCLPGWILHKITRDSWRFFMSDCTCGVRIRMAIPSLLIATLVSASVVAHAAERTSANKESATATEARMSQSLEYLASEELEGRGLGTKGIDLAADYIAEQFRQMG